VRTENSDVRRRRQFEDSPAVVIRPGDGMRAAGDGPAAHACSDLRNCRRVLIPVFAKTLRKCHSTVRELR
jgi:hypothetical protein